MARIRSVKPEFWKSEAIARHDFFTRLVFIGLWTYVDDNGVGIDHYRLITAELFPLEEDFASVSRQVRESLASLADAGRILRYAVDGKAYFAVVNWDEHQRIDRPGKARYPAPDDPRATPTPPTSGNVGSRGTDATPSRESRETPSTGEGEQGRRGEGEKGNCGAPLALHPAPLRLVEEEPTTDLAPLVGEVVPATPVEPENAGQLVRAWVDYCTGSQVKLTNQHIKRYGAGVKKALGEGFTVDTVKRALAEMLADRVASRPGLLNNYLVRVQQGPELPPRRATPGEASVIRSAPAGTDVGALIHDALTRPA